MAPNPRALVAPRRSRDPPRMVQWEARDPGGRDASLASPHGRFRMCVLSTAAGPRPGKPHGPAPTLRWRLRLLVRGHLIGGFALVAYPAQWGASGIMTFIVNHDGVVYQKNLGPKTAATAGEAHPDAAAGASGRR